MQQTPRQINIFKPKLIRLVIENHNENKDRDSLLYHIKHMVDLILSSGASKQSNRRGGG